MGEKLDAIGREWSTSVSIDATRLNHQLSRNNRQEALRPHKLTDPFNYARVNTAQADCPSRPAIRGSACFSWVALFALPLYADTALFAGTALHGRQFTSQIYLASQLCPPAVRRRLKRLVLCCVAFWTELRQELSDLFEVVGPGTKYAANAYVIRRYRCSEANLRTQFHRIIKTAGLIPWPKPFMSLRASRRTELEKLGFKNYQLNDWFGHTAEIAERHYLKTEDGDFAEAVRSVGPSVGQQKPPREITKRKNPGKTGVVMVGAGYGMANEYTPEDSNL